MTVPTPDLTFIMPCYNEEEVIGYTIPRFIAAFRKAGHALELIGNPHRVGSDHPRAPC